MSGLVIATATQLEKMISDLCGSPHGVVRVHPLGADGQFEAKTMQSDGRGGQQAHVDQICKRMNGVYRLKLPEC